MKQIHGSPLAGLCPVCNKEFAFIRRSQGGGTRKIYCSAKCRSLDWAHGNGGKRKAAVLKYDSIPENKDKKRIRTRASQLRRLGWTEADFEQQLTRQTWRCYGCFCSIERQTARVDHCHETGRIRGLLCNSCNWGLGHLKDNPATLRRLMAYLEYDLKITRIYLIGALKNPRIPIIGNRIRTEGYDVMDEWFTPGKFADKNWQEYEKLRGRSYGEALRGRAATNILLFDQSYLDLSDLVILVMPAGKSGMLELGYAKGRGKKTCLFLDGHRVARYDVMPAIADYACITEKELLQWIKRENIYASTDH